MGPVIGTFGATTRLGRLARELRSLVAAEARAALAVAPGFARVWSTFTLPSLDTLREAGSVDTWVVSVLPFDGAFRSRAGRAPAAGPASVPAVCRVRLLVTVWKPPGAESATHALAALRARFRRLDADPRALPDGLLRHARLGPRLRIARYARAALERFWASVAPARVVRCEMGTPAIRLRAAGYMPAPGFLVSACAGFPALL